MNKIILFLVTVLTITSTVFTHGGRTETKKELKPSIQTQTGALSDAEKQYISSAGGYLKSQNEQGMKVATAMDGINTGNTSLNKLQGIIKDARFVTNTAWHGDYLKNGKLNIPDKFKKLNKKIKESYTLRDKAYKEWLAYWKDGNLSHIQNGTEIFKKSEIIAQEATNELTMILKKMND